MYSIFSYLLAKDIIEFPLTVMLAIGFNSIIYWMYGLRKSFSAFIIFVTISYLSGMAGSGFGMFMGTLISNLGVAALFINLSLPLYLLWSGFLKNYGDIPGWSGPNTSIPLNTFSVCTTTTNIGAPTHQCIC